MIPFLQKLVLHDFWLKLFSLVLAILMWFTVKTALAPPGQLILDLPVMSVVEASSGAESSEFSIYPKMVSVTLQGDPRALDRLHKQDVRVRIDLTGLRTSHDLRCPVEVSTPAGISFLRVEPEEIEVTARPGG
jgi:hypothetical protein